MRNLSLAAMVVLLCSMGPADAQTREPLMLQAEVESVYAPPAAGREEEAVNRGGMQLDLTIAYSTDYVYRGIEILEAPGPEDALNLQVDNRLTFDLGKLPHPFVGVFANVADQDPISRFQEIRPYFGAQLRLAPLMLELGHNTYIFPDRDALSTSEVYGKITLDDSWMWGTERPVFAPYIYGAYDYDLYNGCYFEAGVQHEFPFEDWPLTITAYAHVAYVQGLQQFAATAGGDDTGFQHWQVGLVADYNLNTLLNIPKRLGNWSLYGYVNYTDGIDEDLRAETQIWGGAGLRLQY